MAIISVGYDGSVNEAQWARLLPLAGSSHYGVEGPTHWKVTARTSVDRGLSISTGSGWGHGVLDTSDTVVNLTGASVSSGSRWDMVVARRNWGGAGGVTTFALVSGSSNKVLPARNANPGVLDDQPLALVQFTAGSTTPGTIIDLRCWSRNGGMTAMDDMALAYLKEPGTSVYIRGITWQCEVDTAGNAIWSMLSAHSRIPLFGASVGGLTGSDNPQSLVTAQTHFLVQCGSTVQTTDANGYARITFQRPFPGGLLYVSGSDGDDWTHGGSAMFASAGQPFGAEGWGSRSSWVYAMKCQPASQTGGTGSLVLSRAGGANKLHRINWLAIGW